MNIIYQSKNKPLWSSYSLRNFPSFRISPKSFFLNILIHLFLSIKRSTKHLSLSLFSLCAQLQKAKDVLQYPHTKKRCLRNICNKGKVPYISLLQRTNLVTRKERRAKIYLRLTNNALHNPWRTPIFPSQYSPF